MKTKYIVRSTCCYSGTCIIGAIGTSESCLVLAHRAAKRAMESCDKAKFNVYIEKVESWCFGLFKRRYLLSMELVERILSGYPRYHFNSNDVDKVERRIIKEWDKPVPFSDMCKK